ncbi:DegT/DnrJ/EryC1/StrS family aminotransferase [Candidatus Poribacteria bacterium]|jgi:dTDP-4-amino-4,6-dideoxygalactose transaminase|nr:DegT/DnrJ/EryC1/StrS family aminotransferase [Candidatus Poribacteria bacterium]MBT5531406.1 DegT/DnrJ/EryC1/StrS family aminotransferase [Candidatus Poribacteria bacterium]MBT7096040.1 DegT/DnrJ/EryC1/StrS family aminotransferase [Candidatus Poribacteria bacterium]
MATLAINGGTPAVSELRTEWPVRGDLERENVLEVLDSGRWCSVGHDGSKVAAAMEAFREWIGTEHAVACTSGTSALELALRACGIQHGDEILVPAVTFYASASAIVMAGGVPVFVDIDPDTYQISAEAAAAAVTDKTTGIMPVHYGGYPADMDAVNALADARGLFVVEDCAEAHGSEWRGRKVGSLGSVGAFSFQMGKPLTAGEGGAITFDDDAYSINQYQYQRTRTAADGTEESYHVACGNFRMSEFVGAILLSQISRVREQTEARWANGEYLAEELAKIDGVSALKRDPRITKRGYYFYFVRYDASAWNGVSRDRFMEALRAEGVSCGTAHNDPVYEYAAFKDMPARQGIQVDCPEAERVYQTEVVALGKDFLMYRENIDAVVGAIRKLRENVDDIAD